MCTMFYNYRWCKFTDEEHESRGRYLGFRAILEALSTETRFQCDNGPSNTESTMNDTQKLVKLKRRGLTKSQMTSYETFKEHALTRYEFSDNKDCDRSHLEMKLDSLHQRYRKYFKVFEYIVGLQNFVQEILEWFVTLDRLCYLEEHGLQPMLYKIFDQDISPRNNVIFCLKST